MLLLATLPFLAVLAVGITAGHSSLGPNPRQFSVNLFNAVVKASESGDNIAISPYSADAALSMTFLGAAGSTKNELARGLGVPSNISPDKLAAKIQAVSTQSDAYKLKSANALFLEKTYPILPEFKSVITQKFNGEIRDIDFAGQPEEARSQINSFVAGKTDNKITDLLAPKIVGSDTKLVLVNAVYFASKWVEPFWKDSTKTEPFFLASGQQTSVPLMKRKFNTDYAVNDDLDGAQLIKLCYKEWETSMVVILPPKAKGLRGLETSLTAEKLDAALASLQRQEVDVYLPKFKISANYDLVDRLKTLGVEAAFKPTADFSGISSRRDLFVTKVVQKVYVDVDEEGTEAAAATAVVMMAGSSLMLGPPVVPPVFRADHPFLFLIRHEASGAILFMGRVADPTASAN